MADNDALLRRQVENLRADWGRVGIDLRVISKISRSDPVASFMGGDIVSPGSRDRFDEVVQKLGRDATLESLAVQDRFRGLFPEHVLRNAQLRLDGRPEPD